MNSQLPLGRRHSGPQIGLVGSEILGLTYLDPIEQLEFVCSDLVRVLSDFDRFRSYIVGSNRVTRVCRFGFSSVLGWF